MESFLLSAVPRRRSMRTQLISDRISRAIRQDLQLLHRSHSSFYVLGATGNVYTVTLSTSPSCNCPDPTTPCKHILFVFVRVLDVSFDDLCLNLHQCTLLPSQLHRLLDHPTLPDAVTNACLCQRFHQLFFAQRQERRPIEEVEDARSCPICLEDLKKEEKAVACRTCRNTIHEQCFLEWKFSKVNGVATCVICRAPCCNKNDDDQHMYLNLSASTSQQDGQN